MATSNRVKRKEPSTAERVTAHWDSTMSDLSELRASPSEIARRRSSHESKNKLAAKIELQRRALNSVVKSSKKPLPAAFVREVLPKNGSIASERTDMSSPRTLALCADRILERSALITAPSSSSELHNINPAITKRPDSNARNSSFNGCAVDDDDDQSSMLPVQVTPMMRSRLDRLAEAVTAPVALNERSVSDQRIDKKASSVSSLVESKSSKENAGSDCSGAKTECRRDVAPSVSSQQESSIASDLKPVAGKKPIGRSRLPETVAALEQLFSALQLEAVEVGLLSNPSECGESDSSQNDHPTLSGHTALLLRVLLGLVGRVKQLESQLSTLSDRYDSASSVSSSTVNGLTERLNACERKIDGFQEELRVKAVATTESLQRIRAELENIVPKSPNPTNQNDGNDIHSLHDREMDPDFDDFDTEPWLNPVPAAKAYAESERDEPATFGSTTFAGKADKCNIENANRPTSASPPPSSIHCLSGDSSTMFGDRLGSQLAELTRQHEQARARLIAMQRSVNSMGRVTTVVSKP